MTDTRTAAYQYHGAELGHHHAWLLPSIFRILDGLNLPAGERRLFDLGCGNGSVAQALTQRGWDVTGVDTSATGIAQANTAWPDLKLNIGSAYDDLAGQFGQFPVVLSLEVVEHVYAPRHYARTIFELCAGGGGHHFYPISRLLEKSGPSPEWTNGCALHGPLGPRPHQVLVKADAG